jgi:hypothetical protein
MITTEQKEYIVDVYQETSFKECVMYCTDEGIITKEYEKSILEQYNYNEDLESEVVCNFFDSLGINEDEFLELTIKED